MNPISSFSLKVKMRIACIHTYITSSMFINIRVVNKYPSNMNLMEPLAWLGRVQFHEHRIRTSNFP